MGTSGCVAWMFEKKGVIIVEKKDGVDEDELMLFALDNGAMISAIWRNITRLPATRRIFLAA